MIRCDTCGTTALKLVDSNGVTDPADGDRTELYKCPQGHTKFVHLEA